MAEKLNDIEVLPSNKLFEELGDNNYNDVDLISELIDNSIAAKVKDKKLLVSIEIGISEESPEKSYFVIRDNASGIKFSELGDAISPGAKANSSGKTLNEHGLGMKQAIAATGNLIYLKTKTDDEKKAIVVPKFSFGKIKHSLEDVGWKHGTEIRITNLKDILPKTWRVYNERIKSYLGARYRYYLKADEPLLEISFKWVNLDQIESNSFQVKPIKPIYFHPYRRENRPVVFRKEFVGNDWVAKLTFGYAPESEEEYKELGFLAPKNYEPYYVAMKNQGLDILKNRRIVQFHQLADIRLVNTTHPNWNRIRGEIELIDGFSTAITKNKIVEDSNFIQLMAEIKAFLDVKNLIKRKTYPEEIPEAALRDRLKKHLEESEFHKYKQVTKEYSVQGLNGFIDLFAEGDAWEIKVGQASGLDVYQLFAYMDMGKLTKGFLVADSFASGAEVATKFINKNHKKEIKLIKREQFPINQPLSDEETKKYGY